MSDYIQWCNENEGRHYPLAEAATLVANDGTVLPTDIIADLHLMVDASYRNVYISSVWITPTLLGISIAHAGVALASVMINRDTYVPYTAVPLQPMPGVLTLSGWVVFGNYRYTVRTRWLFDGVVQSGLDLRAVKVVTAPPVTTIRKLGAAALYTEKVVKLEGGGYLKLRAHETDPQVILVELDASAMSLFVSPCLSLAERNECGSPALRQINGVCPDANGVITLVIE